MSDDAERDADANEAHSIGVADGRSEAVQEIDLKTGGDGEYRYCMGDHDPERHCPDDVAMTARIVARFEIQASLIEQRDARIAALEGEVARLREAVTEARDTFRHYGDLHAAKPDPVKAQRNYDLAARQDAALKGADHGRG